MVIASCAALNGCVDVFESTGSIAIPANASSGSDHELRASCDELARRYDRDPGEKTASINYARTLRALARYDEAVAVMRVAAIRSPRDFEVLAAYGKALTDSGDLASAQTVLRNAYTSDRPDWTVLSVQGVIADESGDHAGARRLYHEALGIAPDEPFVLNNLGLSYVLTSQLPQAEAALREAMASPRADARVSGNLAMVLELEGKRAEARQFRAPDTTSAAIEATARAVE
jgi:Flp pilus assembly protein TadD